MINKKRLT